jgi:ribonuclease E
LSQQFASHGLQFFKVNKTLTHVAVARPQFLDLATTPVSESIQRIVEFINAHPKCTRRKLIETLAPSPTTIEVKPDEQKSAGPTPEQTALIADLHWLVHQGHVLEFADGKLDTAKKPLPRPQKPEKKLAAGKVAEEKPVSEGEAAAAIETAEPAPQPEAAAEPVAEVSAPVETAAPMIEAAPAIEPAPVSEQANQIASGPPVS